MKKKDFQLVLTLVKRDLAGQSKKQFLGNAWIFMNPLLNIATWMFLNYTGVVKPGVYNYPYYVFLLANMAIWSMFVGTIGNLSATLTSNSSLLLQIKVSKKVLLLKQFVLFLINSLIFNILVFIVLSTHFGPAIFLKLPFFYLFLFPILLLGIGIGLIFSILTSISSEFNLLQNSLTTVLLYITPVFYTALNTENVILKKIITLNPLAHLFKLPSGFLLESQLYISNNWIYAFIFGAAFCLVGLIFFKSSNDLITEKLV